MEGFVTSYEEILDLVEKIDPVKYGTSRNYIDGAVTRLSPYISRGVISLPEIKNSLSQRGFTVHNASKLLQELSWREFYQRSWFYLKEAIFADLKPAEELPLHYKIQRSVIDANTGVEAIDQQIEELYQTGYMHNHVRMYVASVCCNIGRAHWSGPARWLYYHLLDGDLASNCLSWQWVAGTFNGKKYYANQDNINNYLRSSQKNSFLNCSYEELPAIDLPEALQDIVDFTPETSLPVTPLPALDPAKPLLLYNSYNLHPQWRKDQDANRVLLLEPSHFNDFPVSEKVVNFILDLSKNIDGLQIYVGEIKDIRAGFKGEIISIEHPAFMYYPGTKDPYPWMFPMIKSYSPSFFPFWKKCEKQLYKESLQSK